MFGTGHELRRLIGISQRQANADEQLIKELIQVLNQLTDSVIYHNRWKNIDEVISTLQKRLDQ